MKPRALIVEDDDRIIGSIEDSLFSIGHEHDWVTNQHDAQEKLRETEYTYVLLDLQIPAKPNRGGADKEFGCNLLKDIQQIKGPGRIPVIVMTGYSSDCLDLSIELSRNGVRDFISKPFSNNGRTLSSVIRQVLSAYPEPVPADVPSVAKCSPLGRFSGGELILFEDRAELCGVIIMSDMGAGHSLKILNVLTQQDGHGRFVRRSGEELATAIGIAGQAGTVGGLCATSARQYHEATGAAPATGCKRRRHDPERLTGLLPERLDLRWRPGQTPQTSPCHRCHQDGPRWQRW